VQIYNNAQKPMDYQLLAGMTSLTLPIFYLINIVKYFVEFCLDLFCALRFKRKGLGISVNEDSCIIACL